jgi:hypothetical protein
MDGYGDNVGSIMIYLVGEPTVLREEGKGSLDIL